MLSLPFMRCWWWWMFIIAMTERSASMLMLSIRLVLANRCSMMLTKVMMFASAEMLLAMMMLATAASSMGLVSTVSATAMRVWRLVMLVLAGVDFMVVNWNCHDMRLHDNRISKDMKWNVSFSFLLAECKHPETYGTETREKERWIDEIFNKSQEKRRKFESTNSPFTGTWTG